MSGFRIIRVSDELVAWLAEQARPGESPDTVLRRIARLPVREQGRRSSVLKPFENDGGKVAVPR